MEANIEYRFPLFSIFEGALFVDAGNIWRLKAPTDDIYVTTIPQIINNEAGVIRLNKLLHEIAVDWGTGIRINLGFTLIRLDVGFQTFSPELGRWLGPRHWFKEKGYTIQFGIDYPF